MPVIDHKIGLLKDLQDPALAEAYLEECRTLGPKEYELALRDVAEAIAVHAASTAPHNLGSKTNEFYAMIAEQLQQLAANRSKLPAIS